MAKVRSVVEAKFFYDFLAVDSLVRALFREAAAKRAQPVAWLGVKVFVKEALEVTQGDSTQSSEGSRIEMGFVSEPFPIPNSVQAPGHMIFYRSGINEEWEDCCTSVTR
jgi:hypothetical protein